MGNQQWHIKQLNEQNIPQSRVCQFQRKNINSDPKIFEISCEETLNEEVVKRQSYNEKENEFQNQTQQIEICSYENSIDLKNAQKTENKVPNHLIDTYLNQLSSQQIYQFLEQVENQIPQKVRFIIFHWKILPQLIKDAEMINLLIQVNSANNQYKIKGSDQIQAIAYFKKMKDNLNSSVILFQECKSAEEARSISCILQMSPNYLNLKTKLNSEMMIVDSTTQLNLDVFKDFIANINQLKNKNKQAIVFIIIKNNLQSIRELQEIFIRFINDSQNIKIIRDIQTFQLTYPPNLVQIQTDIDSLNIQICEIDIFNLNMDNQTNKYCIEIQCTLWIPGFMEMEQGKQMMNQIESQLFGIFNHKIIIKLKDQNQIEIWENYLSIKYEHNQEQVIIKNNKNADLKEVKINLEGSVGKCMIMQEQIQKELNEIKSQNIELPYVIHPSTFKHLSTNQSIKFRKQLDQIQQQQIDLKIRIININTDKNTITFNILHKNNLQLDQIVHLLQNQLIQKMQCQTIILDLQRFLKYLEIDISVFQETYATIAEQIDEKVTFLSTQYFLQQIKDLIKQFQTATQQLNRTILYKLDSRLVFEKIQNMFHSHTLNLPEQVQVDFIGTTIYLVGPEKNINEFQQILLMIEQQLKSQLIIKKLDLNEQETNFFYKKIKPFKLDLYHQMFECEIKVYSDRLSSRDVIASTLSYQGRELHIAHVDISKFQCEAIVNNMINLMSFENVNMLDGVSRKIFDMAGINYTKFCESQHKTLEFGQTLTYQMPIQNKRVLKFIINISNPIFKNSEPTSQDLLIIQQNIEAIFIEANQRKVKTLALPIFGGGECEYYFKQIAQYVLNHIINNLYSQQNQIVQTVYVTEVTESKLMQICQVLNTILQQPEQIRQVKFQWQWAKGSNFYNYDDEAINKYIDEGYEKFQNQGENLELKLIFPFTKQPGTHLVNLQAMTIIDIALDTTIKLSQENNRFLFDNQQISDAMNEYLMLQKLSNNLEFKIFYKKHKIIFNSNGTVLQLNELTGFQREVKSTPYQKNQLQQNQNILIGKNVKLASKKYDKIKTYHIDVESFDQLVIDELQNCIKNEIKEYTIDFQISLPLMKQEDFNYLKSFILNNSIEIYGDILNGQNLSGKIQKVKQQKILSQIDALISNSKKYPQNWIKQDNNFIKVDLNNNSQEYKEIEYEFTQTYNGRISKIYRLQNQRLWQNYKFEFQKLQEISLQRNTPLTQLEQERYLWHGVKKQHPKKLYNSMKEAFDITYSNKGSWGKGIYFAERAEYSKNYSFKLTKQDDSLHFGQLVFLCCKVATGKIFTCKPQDTLLRPPEGYDCVSGFTNGSNIFVLYGMDVRRAYPAYEIIFK